MILGTSFLGYDSLEDGNIRYLNFDSTKATIGTITIHSNENSIIVDKVYGPNSPITESEFYDIYNYNPVYSDKCYMFADFVSNQYEDIFAAGSMLYEDGSIVGYTVHKISEAGDNVLISNLPPTDYDFNDYRNIYGGQYYITINGKSKTDLSPTGEFNWSINSYISDQLVTSPWGYFIIDEEKERSYFFNTNLENGSEQTNMLVQNYNMNSEFDKFYKGNVSYQRGEFSGILYANNINNVVSSNKDILSDLKEFIYSDRKKLLKTRRGDIYNIIITEFREHPLNIAIKNSPYVANISWSETDGD